MHKTLQKVASLPAEKLIAFVMALPKTFVEGFHDVKAVKKMPYRKLGNTGMELSLIGFGGGGLSGFYEDFQEKDAIEVVREALKKGINYIDTAPYYGEGRSETVIGKALKGVPRQAFYISTKVGRYSQKKEEQFNYTAVKIKSRFQTSLDLLGLDYVDIVILHDVEFARMEDIIHEAIPALQEIIKSGKARYLGISGYPLCRLEEVISKVNANLDLVLSYSRDTLIDSSLHKYHPFFKSKNLGIINAAPTALQMLTNAGPQEWHDASQEIKQLCRKASEYCKENGVELGRLAVYHTLQSPITETLLIGMNSLSILHMNLDLVFNGLTSKEESVLQYIKENILTLKEDLNWEGTELKRYNMVMQ